MSDGHFNRSLLPNTPYHSGLQAGRTQMRLKAQEALRRLLTTHFSDLTDEDLKRLESEFLTELR